MMTTRNTHSWQEESGGQSLTGGTGSGDDLTLSSTANATKGTINLGSTAYIDEVNGNVELERRIQEVSFISKVTQALLVELG